MKTLKSGNYYHFFGKLIYKKGIKIKKSVKIVLLSILILLTLTVIGSNYLHYKMKNEVIPYYIIANEINSLKDTYSLCSGLLLTNPSKRNIQTCNFVYNKIEEKTIQIKNTCPHIYFYTKYIK